MTAVREVWAERNVRVLCGLLFLGFGVFIALTTWLQALLQNYRVSSSTAGALLVGDGPRRRCRRSLAAAAGGPAAGGAAHLGAAVAIAAAGGFVLAFEHAIAVDAVV